MKAFSNSQAKAVVNNFPFVYTEKQFEAYKQALKKLSLDDLLDEYYYTRKNWEAIIWKDDYADMSEDNKTRVVNKLNAIKSVLEELYPEDEE